MAIFGASAVFLLRILLKVFYVLWQGLVRRCLPVWEKRVILFLKKIAVPVCLCLKRAICSSFFVYGFCVLTLCRIKFLPHWENASEFVEGCCSYWPQQVHSTRQATIPPISQNRESKSGTLESSGHCITVLDSFEAISEDQTLRLLNNESPRGNYKLCSVRRVKPSHRRGAWKLLSWIFHAAWYI